MKREDRPSDSGPNSHDRIPPYDDGAEASTLGAILLDSVSVMPMVIAKGIDSESFYVPSHRQIFEEMLVLHRKGVVVEAVTLCERLSASGKADAIGGSAFLNRMIDNTPTAAHAEYYADIVVKKHAWRKAIAVAREVEMMAYDGDADLAEVVGKAQTEMFTLLGTLEAPETNNEAIMDLYDEWIAARDQKPIGIPPHIYAVKERLGVFKYGKPYFVGAAPAGGKSTFMCNAVKFWVFGLGMCVKPIPVAVYSGEMTRGEILSTIICEDADISRFAIDNGMKEPMAKPGEVFKTRLEKAMESAAKIVDPTTGVDKVPLYVTDTEMNIEDLESWTRLMVHKHGIKVLCIDYVQAIEAPKHIKGTERERLVYVAQRIRQLAKSLNIVIIVLSQLSGEEAAKGKRPNPNDLFGSKSLQQVAYGIIMLYNLEGQDYVDIQKNRGGGTGQVAAKFNKARQRWGGDPKHYVPVEDGEDHGSDPGPM